MSSSTDIDPLKLASETTQAFFLLCVTAIISASAITRFTAAELRGLLQQTTPPDDLDNWFAGPCVLICLAAIIYVLQPVLIGRRSGGCRRLARHDPVAERIAELAGRVDVKPPLILVEKRGTSLQAQAYALFGQRVLLGAGVAVLFRRQPDTFDAILLHELGHIKHRDVRRGYLARAVTFGYLLVVAFVQIHMIGWFIYVALGLRICSDVRTCVIWLATDVYRLVANVLVALPSALIVLFAYATVVRMREFYADQVSVSYGAKTRLMAIFQANLDTDASFFRRLTSYHPSIRSRLAAVEYPLPVFSDTRAILFLTGILVGASVNFVLGAKQIREAVDGFFDPFMALLNNEHVSTISLSGFLLFLFITSSLFLAALCLAATGIKGGLIVGATNRWKTQLLNLAMGALCFVAGVALCGPTVVHLGEWLGRGIAADNTIVDDIAFFAKSFTLVALSILVTGFLPALLVARVFRGKCRPSFSIAYCFYFAWSITNILFSLVTLGKPFYQYVHVSIALMLVPGAFAIALDLLRERLRSRNPSWRQMPPHWLIRQ